MSLRLHSVNTLHEAADWLTEETSQRWTPRSVLARLLSEWRYEGENTMSHLLPDALEIALPPSTLLLNRMTDCDSVLERWQTVLVGGVALEKLLYELLQYGTAKEFSVNYGEQRWLCMSPVDLNCIRLPAHMVDNLIPEFDRFLQSSAALCLIEGSELMQRPKDDAQSGVGMNAEDAAVEHSAKGTPPALTADKKSEIARRFRNRESVNKLAQDFGVHNRTIDAALMEFGLKNVKPRKGRKATTQISPENRMR
ncbi:hypothetical protein [Comamonas aquatica]|uniref:hypothetical protein n=1 Tax=Comamonas aquatica TaxID=225991 RepID=UPI002446CAE4|nr:hypothetical protein [Comamonas aquatica]MDH1813905.1 hypothetical protein [Comamonas aquatica]